MTVFKHSIAHNTLKIELLSLKDKSITMKTLITFTFLLFTLLGFSQTTREEVVKRTDGGLKLEVLTYSGTGNSEKLVKITKYTEKPDMYSKDRINNISSKPRYIEYYGNYRVEFVNKFVNGDPVTSLCYGQIKWETFDGSGKLKDSWKISDYNGEVDMSKLYSFNENMSMYTLFLLSPQGKLYDPGFDSFLKGTITYTLIP